MDELFTTELQPLLDDRPGPCVSLYFSNSSPGSRTSQGAIHLKNLLHQVESVLLERLAEQEEVDDLLDPVRDLLGEDAFWQDPAEGVAIFRAPSFLQVRHLDRAFPERWFVGEHFFLKPLLPLVAGDHVFHILALSQNEVRLLEVGGGAVRRLTGADLPKDLEAALGSQKAPQYLQYHTASSAPAGALPAQYYGQGASAGDTKDELRRFLRQVDRAVCDLLAGRSTPLVLAGADPLPALYREISGYPHLSDRMIPGNPERLTDESLRDRAGQLLEPVFQASRRHTFERFDALIGTGKASTDVAEILPAARHGRVESLFLACDADVWGRLDSMEKVEVHAVREEGDQELLDTAALFSLRQGGTVYGLNRGEVPGGGDLAAVFRY
jgi:hypothetical protein